MDWDYLARLVEDIRQILGAPGASIAVGDGRDIVFQFASGVSDLSSQAPLSTDHVFRIGSLSKILTGAAVAKLIESRDLSFDETISNLLPGLSPGSFVDERIAQITLRHLLQLRVSFAENTEIFDSYAETLGVVGPKQRLPVEFLVETLQRAKLLHMPGVQWTWNLTTYAILGRVIERASGLSYEEFIRRHLIGAACPDVEIGSIQPQYRAKDEAIYHVTNGASIPAPHYLGIPDDVTPPYREQIVQLRDSNGGWIVRPRDLVTILMSLFDPDRNILSRPAIHLMERRPKETSPDAPEYFGGGLFVKTNAKYPLVGTTLFHQQDWSGVGGLIGTINYTGRRRDGLTWVLSLNGTPNTKDLAPFYRLFGVALWGFFGGRFDLVEEEIARLSPTAGTRPSRPPIRRTDLR